MKSYLVYKNQIKELEDVRETIKMAEKIAAANIHFLKQAEEVLNKYTKEIEAILDQLTFFYQNPNHLLLTQKPGQRALIIIGADTGLVGGLWHNLVDAYFSKKRQYQYLITVGAKIKQYLEEEKIIIQKSFVFNPDVSLKEKNKKITDYIFFEFAKSTFTRVDVLFSEFISLAEQKPKILPFLPFNFGIENTLVSNTGWPIFEPSKKMFFNRLLQKYIKISFYRTMLEAEISKLAAKTVVTEHTVEKTKKIIRKLKLDYFKIRRANLTKRQLENFAAHKIV